MLISKLALCLTGALTFTFPVRAVNTEPTHVEIDPIKVQLGPKGQMKTIAMDSKGNLLAGVMWYANGNQKKYGIKKISPQGKLLQTWVLKGDFLPKMIHGCDDGMVYVGGHGYLAMFDENGNEKKRIDLDKVLDYKAITAGLYVTDKYVFAAYGSGNSMRAVEEFHRFNRDLTGSKKIIERQYGCCAHIDMEVVGDKLLIAENSRHRMNVFDLEGNKLGTWGKRDRTNIEGFTACCNPCNTDIAGDGSIFTVESGVGRVKRFTPDGKYLGLVGYIDTTKFDRGSKLAAQSCYIPSEVSADGKRVYVMDVRQHFIRVLEQK
jgi:hypothetical protein